MATNTYPFLEPVIRVNPQYIHLSDIDSIGSFFVFMDAAIRCHPFVLVGSFTGTLFFIYIILNSKEIYRKIICSYSNYLCNKNLYNKGGE